MLKNKEQWNGVFNTIEPLQVCYLSPTQVPAVSFPTIHTVSSPFSIHKEGNEVPGTYIHFLSRLQAKETPAYDPCSGSYDWAGGWIFLFWAGKYQKWGSVENNLKNCLLPPSCFMSLSFTATNDLSLKSTHHIQPGGRKISVPVWWVWRLSQDVSQFCEIVSHPQPHTRGTCLQEKLSRALM